MIYGDVCLENVTTARNKIRKMEKLHTLETTFPFLRFPLLSTRNHGGGKAKNENEEEHFKAGGIKRKVF